LSLAASSPAEAQLAVPTLFQNVRIFDGKSGAVSAPSSVLVRDNKIERISTSAITVAGARAINGGGRVLMPGLVDAYWHAMLVRPNPAAALANDVGYTNIQAAAEALSPARAFIRRAPRTGEEVQAEDGLRHRHSVFAGIGQTPGRAPREIDPLVHACRGAGDGDSTNAELLALSGPRNPYPGKLGVVDEGALADLLLVDGNRIEDIHLLEDRARNLRIIMKDGRS
jgi:imidazolonepropionase-like amidohydrolase